MLYVYASLTSGYACMVHVIGVDLSCVCGPVHDPWTLRHGQALTKKCTSNVNLTKLESRPIIGSPWEYKFYIDYQNSVVDIDTQLKDKLDLVTKKFKIIGRYGTIDL